MKKRKTIIAFSVIILLIAVSLCVYFLCRTQQLDLNSEMQGHTVHAIQYDVSTSKKEWHDIDVSELAKFFEDKKFKTIKIFESQLFVAGRERIIVEVNVDDETYRTVHRITATSEGEIIIDKKYRSFESEEKNVEFYYELLAWLNKM